MACRERRDRCHRMEWSNFNPLILLSVFCVRSYGQASCMNGNQALSSPSHINSLGLPRNSVASSMKAWPSPHRMQTAISAIFVGMWIFSPVIIDRPSSFSALAAHYRRALLRHPWALCHCGVRVNHRLMMPVPPGAPSPPAGPPCPTPPCISRSGARSRKPGLANPRRTMLPDRGWRSRHDQRAGLGEPSPHQRCHAYIPPCQ
jgi:hypothetical protein